MALTNLAVFGGAFFTPILVGKITISIGWAWSFYFVAIFSGVCLPLVIFFIPETAFRRSSHLNTDMVSSDDLHLFQKPIESGHKMHASEGEGPTEKSATDAGQTTEANRSNPEDDHAQMYFTGSTLEKSYT